MGDQLTRFGAGGTKAHAVHDVVKTAFEQFDQDFTRVATTTLGFDKITTELLFKYAVHALELLLFAKLQAVIGRARTRRAAVLARAGFQSALGIQRTTGAFQEKIGALATRELAFRSCITCQSASP